MNAKEMLQSAYSLHCAILIKREQISILEDSITNITVSLDRERVSKSPDPSSILNRNSPGFPQFLDRASGLP